MESLSHLALVWLAIYLAFIAARITRLTPVLWYLAMGSLLVNVGLLPKEPDAFIRGLGEVGIVMIMFALGFEEQTDNFIESIKRSWGIAFFGATAPFFTAYAVADAFFDDHNIALMSGLTMTATAVSLTMVSLRSEGLHRSEAATRIMTSAVLDDIASLALVAVMVPIAAGQTTVDVLSIGFTVAKAILFFVFVSALGPWLLPVKTTGWLSRIPLLGRHGIRHVLSFSRGENATLTVLLLALLVGLLAHFFGFHPAVGAYMAGLVLKEEYFHIDDEESAYLQTKQVIDSVAFYSIGPVFFVELGTKIVFDWDIFVSVVPQTISEESAYLQTKQVIDSVAFYSIGPVFFVELGTKIVFDWDIFVSVVPQTIVMTVSLFVAQIASAAIAARYTSGLDWANSMMVGFGMLGRAELAFVVMDIAYVQNSILSTEAFYTLMFTAFWLNVAVPVTIVLWKPYCDSGVDPPSGPG